MLPNTPDKGIGGGGENVDEAGTFCCFFAELVFAFAVVFGALLGNSRLLLVTFWPFSLSLAADPPTSTKSPSLLLLSPSFRANVLLAACAPRSTRVSVEL